jgi:hypothetical protein
LSDGRIIGSPLDGTVGIYEFQVSVRDSQAGNVAYQRLTLTVDPAQLLITTNSLPPGTVGAVYSTTLSAAGGVPPHKWSIAAGSRAPDGLALSADGTITGTPTTAGASVFTVQAEDPGVRSVLLVRKQLTLLVNLAVTTTSLPAGTVGVPYSAALAAAGGDGAYAWSVFDGTSLPTGLTLNSDGTITGTPTSAGTGAFTVMVTDPTLDKMLNTLASLTLVVNPAPLVITTTSLPGGTVGAPYSASLAAIGGSTPYTWSPAPTSTFPAGLTLNPAGTITGTPATAGTAKFTVQVTDAATPTQTTTRELTITVVPAPLVVTTMSLPAATYGAPYTVTLTATGGTTPYQWSLATGTSLPPGFSLTSDGTITGKPTAIGTTTFTIAITDVTLPTAYTASKDLTITVVPPLPTVSGVAPRSAPAFTLATIRGTNLTLPHTRCLFSIARCGVTVRFGAQQSTVVAASPTMLIVLVPRGQGTVDVTVTVGGRASPATPADRFTYVSRGPR